jgi:hypothetical protein
MFREACRMCLEGIVSKRLGSLCEWSNAALAEDEGLGFRAGLSWCAVSSLSKEDDEDAYRGSPPRSHPKAERGYGREWLKANNA